MNIPGGSEVLSKDQAKGSPLKSLSDRMFEVLLVTVVLASIVVAHQLVGANGAVLHFFYLPVMIAAHWFGRRLAGTIALFSVLVVVIFAMLDPGRYLSQGAPSPLVLALNLAVWGAFLGLNTIVIGTLCDQRVARITQLKEAYMGIIEVMSKYLQAADQYTKSHSIRVAELAESIAREMQLKPDEIEDIRVGALLHDIGKVEISTRLIQKAAALTEEERDEMSSHTVQGAELVRSLGSIMSGAATLIAHHHDHYSSGDPSGAEGQSPIPMGARIIAVADTYDAIVTDRPYRKGRTPREAVAVIREASGGQFDPKVARAFESVMLHHLDESDVAEAHRHNAAHFPDSPVHNAATAPPESRAVHSARVGGEEEGVGAAPVTAPGNGAHH